VQNICRYLNRERAGVLNHYLAAWLETAVNERITVVASFGGSELPSLATQRSDFPVDFFFEPTVPLSASAPPDWAMGLASISRDGSVFSYASDADEVLVASRPDMVLVAIITRQGFVRIGCDRSR